MKQDSMFVAERWERIAQMLKANGRATVEDVSERLGVSPSTIRRDLRRMHREGLVIRTRGGAIRPEQVSFDRSIAESLTQQKSEMEEIGRFAATLIEAGVTLMIDGGATTLQLAKHLRTNRIVVVTNSFDIVGELKDKDGVSLIMVGGVVRGAFNVTHGPTAITELSRLKADKAIIGINGISAEDGLTAPDPLSAELKASMIGRSREVIVLADHTKIGHVGLCQVAPIGAVDKLITDHKASPEQVAELEEAGVEVLIAH